MPLGLPNHLAPRGVSRAFSRAAHAVAFVCLIGALLIAVSIQFAQPELILWPAILALVPFLAVLVLLDRRRTTFFAVTYLLVGGACMYWYAVTGTFEVEMAGRTDSLVLSLPKVALIAVGAGAGPVSASLWAIAGLAVGEGVTILAASQAGGVIVPDGTTLIALLIMFVVLTFIALNRRSVSGAQSSVTRAARDEQLSEVRSRIEAQATAIMHDTVLGHLAALSVARPGSLSHELRAQIARDLEVLVGEEWLLDTDVEDEHARATWRESTLFQVVEDSRDLGLTINVSGDVSALARVDTARASAVALAVKQCLVNVLHHSGTRVAEVVVYGAESDMSIMVIDSGVGFSEAETGSDRLGLKQSVRRRIETVGGAVQVWSTPGQGTSVMIRVPLGSERRDGAISDAAALQ